MQHEFQFNYGFSIKKTRSHPIFSMLYLFFVILCFFFLYFIPQDHGSYCKYVTFVSSVIARIPQ